MTDSVADFLTRIRNALRAHQDEVVIPYSRFGSELARLLADEGYIEGYSVEAMRRTKGSRKQRGHNEFQMLRIRLKYSEDRQSVISGLKRVSRPGRRQYVTADTLPRVLGGMGTAVLTTSRGLMTANEANRQRVGGEVVAHVW